jgi:hypothetical protein
MPLAVTFPWPALDRPRRSDPRRGRLFTRSNGSVNEFVVFRALSIGYSRMLRGDPSAMCQGRRSRIPGNVKDRVA